MSYRKIEISDLTFNPFTKIGKDWILVSAKNEAGKINTMTASWGALGIMWNLNVATIYIRPQRYTREFIEDSDYFTLTFFDNHKKELGVLGRKSGRESDKIKDVGFEIEMLANQPTFKQGEMVMICKKIYRSQINPSEFIDSSLDQNNYQQHDYHYVYMGEIQEVYVNEKD